MSEPTSTVEAPAYLPSTAQTSSLEEAPAACPLPPPKRGLTKLEKGELVAIPLALALLYAFTRELSWSPRFGALVAYASALFLGQGLVRDVVRLGIEGRKKATVKLLCMCAETTIGVVALVAGLAVLGIGIKDTVTLGGLGLTALAGAILAFGFVAKDYVLVLRKVTDHGGISVG